MQKFFSWSSIFLCTLILIAKPVSLKAEELWDPLEPLNRKIFWFNDKFDYYIMEPIAEGYEDIMPDSVEECVGNFFSNLKFPVLLVSDVVQLKFGQALTHTRRFLLNSTVGFAGFFDVATAAGIKEHDEDFGTALGYYGIGEGPYLVIPFIGPSNLRDGFGLAVDSFISPLSYINYADVDSDTQWGVTVGTRALQLVDTRAGLLDAIDSAKEASVDFYLFMQAAYHQHRQGLIYDGNAPEEEDVFADDAEQVVYGDETASPEIEER